MSTARSLVEARFEASVNPVVNRGSPAIAAVASRLMIQDPDRLGFLVVNLSVNDVYMMIDGNVSATRGIKIGPNGGSIATIWFEDFEIVAWEWFAIAPAGASSVLVIEYLAGH